MGAGSAYPAYPPGRRQWSPWPWCWSVAARWRRCDRPPTRRRPLGGPTVTPTVDPSHAGPVQQAARRADLPARSVGPARRPGDGAALRATGPAGAGAVPAAGRGYRADGPVRVLGDDGVVRSLDVVTLAPTRDAGGNEAAALKPGVLSPDGRSAAFAQTKELVMVDLTTAAVRRIPLDGYLELVVWAHDRVLVGGDDRTYAVDRVTGAASTIDVSTWDLVAPDPAAGREAPLIEMSGERDRPDATQPDRPGGRRPLRTAGHRPALPLALPGQRVLRPGLAARRAAGPARLDHQQRDRRRRGGGRAGRADRRRGPPARPGPGPRQGLLRGAGLGQQGCGAAATGNRPRWPAGTRRPARSPASSATCAACRTRRLSNCRVPAR